MKHILFNVLVKSRLTDEEIGCIGVTASEVCKIDGLFEPHQLRANGLWVAKKKFSKLFGIDNLDRFDFIVVDRR